MLHRDMKGKGILLRLTRDILDEPSKSLIEEPFTTFHNRTPQDEPLRDVCGFKPLPFETFIKMFNFIIFTDDKKVGHQEDILMI